VRIALLFCAALPLLAQQAAPLAFEVATIKPVGKISLADLKSGNARIGTRIDAGQVDISSAPLDSLVARAYRVPAYQLTAPDWSHRQPYFDVVAKIPEGRTAEQVPEMLRALLEERFKLTTHRETKPQLVYVLTVNKGKTKLKPAPAGAPESFEGTQRSEDVQHFQITSDMAGFAQNLTSLMGRPVLDRTGLKGVFQMEMNVANPDSPDDATRSPGAEFVSAVGQLGLKLVMRQEPVPMIVVDHLEKMPSEN